MYNAIYTELFWGDKWQILKIIVAEIENSHTDLNATEFRTTDKNFSNKRKNRVTCASLQSTTKFLIIKTLTQKHIFFPLTGQ